jgi:adenylate kinase
MIMKASDSFGCQQTLDVGGGIYTRANGESVRADDNEKALSVRLTAYANQTKPLTDYYLARGLLRTIDASQPIDQVTAALIDAIGNRDMLVP